MRIPNQTGRKPAFASLLALMLGGCTTIPCVIFCTDQTTLQAGYVEARDECREVAELKAGMQPGSSSNDTTDKAQKTKLVSLFSECMTAKGWSVPNPAEDKKKDTAAAPPPKVLPLPLELPAPAPQQARNKRAAECAFARQAAESSVVAAKRAEACDIECRDLKRIAPEAPRPGACE